MVRALFCCVVALAGAPVHVAAQRATMLTAEGLANELPALSRVTRIPEPPDTPAAMPLAWAGVDRRHSFAALSDGAPDYRWEGLAIGAVAVGALGAIALSETCEGSGGCVGSTIGGALIGALVGGVTGGLIGGLIPKGS